MDKRIDSIIRELEESKRRSKKGGEYWLARDIHEILGYSYWNKFEPIINKARTACKSIGENPDDHIYQTVKMVEVGSGAMVNKKDYFLTRYGCYLIAMNGNPSKEEIGIAQTYFAIQTRKQEMQDQLTNDLQRIQSRDRVIKANRSLSDAAKDAGVQRYDLFHDAGYRGLYEMGLADIKKRKGIAGDLLDCAGRAELAANEFRITQTEEKLKKEAINSQQHAIDTHEGVGREVRTTIEKIGGAMPEDLPPEPSIKKITTRYKKISKQIEKLNV